MISALLRGILRRKKSDVYVGLLAAAATSSAFNMVFIARQRTDAILLQQICMSVCPSVCPSVRYVPVSYENGLTCRHSFS